MDKLIIIIIVGRHLHTLYMPEISLIGLSYRYNTTNNSGADAISVAYALRGMYELTYEYKQAYNR